jgi:hypothetical protein
MRTPRLRVKASLRGSAVAVQTPGGWSATPEALAQAVSDYLLGKTTAEPTIRFNLKEA